MLLPERINCRLSPRRHGRRVAQSFLVLAALAAASGETSRKFVQEGVAVELSIRPLAGSAPLQEGQDVEVRLQVTDTATGSAIGGLRPAAWLDLRTSKTEDGPNGCRAKVQAFLGSSLSARPTRDLNTYYVLALNDDASISVIDPLLGYGGSKLLTTIPLKSPGKDWVLSRDGRRLFVSMPRADEVAVVDTGAWKVIAGIAVAEPGRMALEADQKYLWVSSANGVTVIDAAALKSAGHVSTGAGNHEIAFAAGDRYAFIANRTDGTVSVVDIGALRKIRDVRTGKFPLSIAVSELNGAVYVAHEEGGVAVLDAEGSRIQARIETGDGATGLRFAPGGRWGLVTKRHRGVLHVFDSSANRVVQSLELGSDADQIAFSDNSLFLRSPTRETVRMIALSTLGGAGKLAAFEFPGGQTPPDASTDTSLAPTIVASPEGNAMLVASPADRTIYYYKEGMAAPMGSFKNYGRQPLAVLVVDRSLREGQPGIYSTVARLPKSGSYDVPVLLDSPRLTHCFHIAVAPGALAAKAGKAAPKVEALPGDSKLTTGEEFTLRFRLADPESGEAVAGARDVQAGARDVQVLLLEAGGNWRAKNPARAAGSGLYETTFTAPRAGVYYAFFESQSLGLRPRQNSQVVLQAGDRAASCHHDAGHPAAAPSAPSAGKTPVVPDVAVIDQDGRPLRFRSDLIKGKTVAINFIFTTCTTVCPPMGATFGKLQKLIGGRLGTDVELISVSVDPVTDTPARLKAWAAKFNARAGWTLVTGDKASIDRLLRELGAYAPQKESHSPLVLVMNEAAGRWTRANGVGNAERLAELVLGTAGPAQKEIAE